jgi:hypothetical protein
MSRSTFAPALVLGLALAATLPSPAQAGTADPAVKALLDAQKMKYEIDSDGDFKVTFDLGKGRSQLVWIRSATETYGTLKVREIWSPGYKLDGELSAKIANRLLEHSHAMILGGWTKQKAYAMFVVKISTTASPQQVRDAAEAAADAADDIEQELTPGSDEL